MARRKHNQRGYRYYVLNNNSTRIESGWEYKEDAADNKKELGVTSPILMAAKLKRMGIDPDDNKSWEEGKGS